MDADRAAPEEEKLTDLERRIVADAQRFDLRPLMDVLRQCGYTRDDIVFESAAHGRSAGVVRAVRFRRRPVRSAVVTVEMGLLGDNTLLPSYFYHVLERATEADRDRLTDFLRFFDHRLIEGMFLALHPEEVPALYRSWPEILRTFLRMSVPASIDTLHWLAQLYFPELRVKVTRAGLDDPSAIQGIRTGGVLDGTGVLGKTYHTVLSGFRVDLIAEDEVDLSGRPYAEIVLDRLATRLLPCLAEFGIGLVVRLVVTWHGSWAHLATPGAATNRGYLGYDRLRYGDERRHTTVIYRGVTGETPPPAGTAMRRSH